MTKDKKPAEPATGADTHEVGAAHYVIGARRGMRAAAAGITPLSANQFDKALEHLEDHEHVRVVRARKVRSTMSARSDEATHHVVARLTPERVAELRNKLPDHLIVEKQVRFEPKPALAALLPSASARATAADVSDCTYRFVVLGEGDAPLADVPVSLFDEGGASGNATTAADGTASIRMRRVGSAPFHGFYAKPVNSYWDMWVSAPTLQTDRPNVVRLQSLSEMHPGFPGNYAMGWGQQIMGLARVPDGVDGRGARVAIIDSGLDNAHPLLTHVQDGTDLTAPDAPGEWTRDLLGHGTHVAGVITARPAGDLPFRGFAPGAEVHVCKIFPGGTSDALIEALDKCLQAEVDVVNMSLGSDEPSALVEQKLEELYAAGIACIVAAGNSGAGVQFPARSPFVLAVAAIGTAQMLVQTSWDFTQFQPEQASPDGIFSPRFSCSGPQVAVAAPGVGIVSTLPGGTFGPDTGTSMATPHITGLATLLVAHHPALAANAVPRGPARVVKLFALLRELSAPLQFSSWRSGAGVPVIQAANGSGQ